MCRESLVASNLRAACEGHVIAFAPTLGGARDPAVSRDACIPEACQGRCQAA
jgi:hypothetical protein